MTQTKLQPQAVNDNLMSNSLSRQAIINGNFDVWQRGTSFTVNGYGADRWSLLQVGSTFVKTRQAFTLGQTDVPLEPSYYMRNVVTTSVGAGNLVITQYKIEIVRSFAGQTVTASFWAKADSSKNISIEFEQNFGDGGSP